MKKSVHVIGLVVISFMVCMMPIFPSTTASAATHSKVLMSQQNTIVQKGQAIEDVLVLGHNVTVHGDVSEILVVIDGNIHLTSTARTGIVVDLGGIIHQDSGALVNTLYQVPLHTPFWNGALFGVVFALLLWVSVLAVGIALILLSIVVTVGLRHHLKIPLSHIEKSVRNTGALGLFISLATLAVASLCAITIIGLPLAGILALIYLAAGIVGFAVVSVWLGRLSSRYSIAEPRYWMLSIIGASLLVALMCIPFLGILLFCIAWFIGVGTVTSWLTQVWSDRRALRR